MKFKKVLQHIQRAKSRNTRGYRPQKPQTRFLMSRFWNISFQNGVAFAYSACLSGGLALS